MAAAAAAGKVLPAEGRAAASAAAAALARGDVVALPTDTLYGLAASASSSAGIARLYAIKGRDRGNPLAVSVASSSAVVDVAEVAHLPAGLLADLLPGPVTLVLPRRHSDDRGGKLAAQLNPGLEAIGVRVPDAEFVREVARQLDGPIALTSANFSSQPSTVAVDEFRDLWPQCALVFDGGRLASGRAGSTIVDLTAEGQFRILRDGSALAETCSVLTDKHGLKRIPKS
eukprot:jgi/Chlat1/2446/Chrsp171S02339